MTDPPLAHKKCMKCDHEWDDYPGGFAKVKPRNVKMWKKGVIKDVGCPNCKSIYYKWTNYVPKKDTY